MTRYRDFLASIAPPWLAAPQGQAWFRAIGDGYDELLERAKDAVKQRLALHATDDGLAQLGVDRNIDAGPGETTASYGARLKGAWKAWSLAGTPLGMLLALQAGGFVADIRIQNALRFTLDANGNLVTEARAGEWWIDSNRSFWSRFVVLIVPPFPWAGGVPADGANDALRCQRLIRRWKPAHATCTDILVISSGRTWGYYPTGSTWGAQGRATWGSDLATLTRWSP